MAFMVVWMQSHDRVSMPGCFLIPACSQLSHGSELMQHQSLACPKDAVMLLLTYMLHNSALGLQIHMMLFWIAIMHIVCSYVLIRVSTARVKIWRHWLAEDDAHSKA